MPDITVSVIITAYNAQDTIGNCIQAVLDMNYPKEQYEILVVDNNSKDGTANIIKKYPVTYVLENQNQSPAASRNTGAKSAKGMYLAFIDDDQFVDSDWLARIIILFEDKKVGAVGGVNTFKPEEARENDAAFIIQKDEWDTDDLNVDENFFQLGGGNSVVKADYFNGINGFDISMFSSEDFDFYYRLKQEFNCLIKIALQAKVYNFVRNENQLVKREYRIGFGDAILSKKYSFLKKNNIKIFLNVLITLLKSFVAILLTFIKLHDKEQKRNKINFIWLNIRMKTANFLGRLHYILKWKNGIIPADW